MRFSADKPGALSATVDLADAHGAKTVAEVQGKVADLRSFGAFPAHDYKLAGVKKTWKPLAREARLRETRFEAGGVDLDQLGQGREPIIHRVDLARGDRHVEDGSGIALSSFAYRSGR